jgi:hypothetical protein
LVILLTSIPVAGAFGLTTKSPFLGTFGTTSSLFVGRVAALVYESQSVLILRYMIEIP